MHHQCKCYTSNVTSWTSHKTVEGRIAGRNHRHLQILQLKESPNFDNSFYKDLQIMVMMMIVFWPASSHFHYFPYPWYLFTLHMVYTKSIPNTGCVIGKGMTVHNGGMTTSYLIGLWIIWHGEKNIFYKFSFPKLIRNLNKYNVAIFLITVMKSHHCRLPGMI